MIRFLLNDALIELPSPPTDLTVLDWLRLQKRLTGTKEGCGSGDCGACTVVLVSPSDTPSGLPLHYQSANSCILMIGALQGKQLITVDHIGSSTNLHPVQQALVNHHGSQCGFCTPGFVMSLFAMFHQNFDDPMLWQDRHQAHALIEQYLAGNLCRCTGYAPIMKAAMDVMRQRFDTQISSELLSDDFDKAAKNTAKALVSIRPSQRDSRVGKSSDDESSDTLDTRDSATVDISVHVPTSLQSALRLWKKWPQCEIIAGGTDKALDVTQSLNRWDGLIHLNAIPELKIIEHRAESLVIGAGVSIAALLEALTLDYPDAVPMLLRFGSEQVRSQATVGGNLGSASPIGDLAPMLLALDAQIELVSLSVSGDELVYRKLALSDYFVSYGETQLATDEWIHAVHIPSESSAGVLRVYKVSKRMDDDISTVCAAVWMLLDQSSTATVIKAVRLGFGGMAATPKRAVNTEKVMQGAALTEQTIEQACKTLAQDFSPISDVRASAQYRSQVAGNLLKRYYLESMNGEAVTQIHQAISDVAL